MTMPEHEAHRVPQHGRARCCFRRCRRWLPAARGSGRRAAFCDRLCRRRERWQREIEARPTEPVKPRRRYVRAKYAPGSTYGALTLLAYAGTRHKNSDGLFACACGDIVVKRIAYVVEGLIEDCADSERHHKRRQALPTYNTVHRRLVRDFGAAREHPCARCGRVSEHAQWSFRYGSYDVNADHHGPDKGRLYSTDPGDYWPLCKGCHARFDGTYRRIRIGDLPSLPHVALQLAYLPALNVEGATL